jgi:hypothetical protein
MDDVMLWIALGICWAGIATWVASALAARNAPAGGGHSGFFSLAEDASAGTTVSIPKADVFGRPVTAGKRMLLVVLDSCTTCAAKSIKRGPKPEDLTLPAIFVFTDTKAHVLAEMKGAPESMGRFLADPDFKIGSQLNAVWLPRIYVLDEHFKLIESQQNPNDSIWKRYQK